MVRLSIAFTYEGTAVAVVVATPADQTREQRHAKAEFSTKVRLNNPIRRDRLSAIGNKRFHCQTVVAKLYRNAE